MKPRQGMQFHKSWCDLFKEIDHRDRTRDTDGDGVTDFQEMLAMTNPTVVEAEARAVDPEAVQIKLIKIQKEWEATLTRARGKGMLKLITSESPDNDPRVAKHREIIRKGNAKILQMTGDGLRKERERSALANEMNIPLVEATPGGTLRSFRGAPNGKPVYTSSDNRVAAASISADELWPDKLTPLGPNLTPWPSASTGLGLTGSGETVAIWENDGGVNVGHFDFGGRVNQRDVGTPLDTTGHATNVAGTLAGSGSRDVDGKGIAFAASIEAFDVNALADERLKAANGFYGKKLTVGNNSWSTIQGWTQFDLFNPVIQTFSRQWLFEGSADFGPGREEDPKYGRYTIDTALQFDCVEIDKFVHETQPHHLPVWSSGNDTGSGPQDINLLIDPDDPTSGRNFYYGFSDTGQFVRRSKFTFPRDWEVGDDGGFDSLSIPGTAKNVLTVGACFDVTHVDTITSNVVPGFGPGSQVLITDFSGAGPTDDGRIKPDLVAVGDALDTARTALGISATDGLVTANDDSNTSIVTDAAGTSFSAPAVTGGIALMLERRRQLEPGLSDDDLWWASTLKALAINGCDDPGPEGPDFKRGHGLFNVAKSVETISKDYSVGRGCLIKEFSLDANTEFSWAVEVDGSKPLSITAVWSDVEGIGQPYIGLADTSGPVLVNNIDIELENLETGDIWRPWVLDPDISGQSQAAREAPATRGVDSINNVERITHENLPSGFYKITVKHSGGITGSKTATSQDVSVVANNALPVMAVINSLTVSPDKSQFILSYTADPGASFIVETSTTMLDGSWTSLGSTVAVGVNNTVEVTTAAGAARRFLRLKRL